MKFSQIAIKSQQDTWKELDELRSTNNNFRDFDKVAEVISENIDYEMLIDYLLTCYPYSGEAISPTKVAKLIAEVGKSFVPKSVADLCCGVGNISRFFAFAEVDGYEINVGTIKLAKKLLPHIKFYNQCVIREPIEKKYDLVVSHPPFGMGFEIDGKFQTFEKLIVEKSLSILNDNGILLCIFAKSFLFSHKFKQVRKELVQKHGLEHIIEFPARTFTNTGISSALVVLKKNGTTKSCKSSIFQSDYIDLKKSLLKRKNISKKQLLLDWVYQEPSKSQSDIEDLLKKNKIQSKKTKLRDIATVVNGYQAQKNEKKSSGEYLLVSGKNIQNNSLITSEKDVYLDAVRNRNSMKCILQQGDILISTIFNNRKIYQFKDLDPNCIASNNIKIIRSAKSDYLANYLQTKTFNKEFQEQCNKRLKGAVIPYLTKKDLEDLDIYIMPIESLINHIQNPLKEKLKSKDGLMKSILENIRDQTQKKMLTEILVEHFEDPIIKLARSLEGLTLEFKSSYKTPIEKSPIPEKILVKKLKHGVIKTIAAFANTKGGNLLIGVSDENKIVGIEVDKFKNTDEFIRGVTRQIEIDLKPNPMTIHDLINFSSTTKNGKTIVCINVKPASRPIYAYNKPDGEKTELLYTRKSASSESLTLRETVRYIKERFPDF